MHLPSSLLLTTFALPIFSLPTTAPDSVSVSDRPDELFMSVPDSQPQQQPQAQINNKADHDALSGLVQVLPKSMNLPIVPKSSLPLEQPEPQQQGFSRPPRTQSWFISQGGQQQQQQQREGQLQQMQQEPQQQPQPRSNSFNYPPPPPNLNAAAEPLSQPGPDGLGPPLPPRLTSTDSSSTSTGSSMSMPAAAANANLKSIVSPGSAQEQHNSDRLPQSIKAIINGAPDPRNPRPLLLQNQVQQPGPAEYEPRPDRSEEAPPAQGFEEDQQRQPATTTTSRRRRRGLYSEINNNNNNENNQANNPPMSLLSAVDPAHAADADADADAAVTAAAALTVRNEKLPPSVDPKFVFELHGQICYCGCFPCEIECFGCV